MALNSLPILLALGSDPDNATCARHLQISTVAKIATKKISTGNGREY